MSQDNSDNSDAEIHIDSNADDSIELADELVRVFDDMKAHAARTFPQLLFVADAVNGNLAVAWYSSSTRQLDETRVYFLDLNKIWKTSLEHDEGASYYEKECRIAVCCFMEKSIYDEEGNESNEVYFKTDISKLERLII